VRRLIRDVGEGSRGIDGECQSAGARREGRAADGGQGSAAGLDGEGGDGAGGIVRDVEEVAAGIGLQRGGLVAHREGRAGDLGQATAAFDHVYRHGVVGLVGHVEELIRGLGQYGERSVTGADRPSRRRERPVLLSMP